MSRYTVLHAIGTGAGGVVCAARDEESNECIAIKKIENVFGHFTFTKRTLRELRILRQLRHENVMDVRNAFVLRDKDSFQDIYVVSELMDTDLASIIRSEQPLNSEHVHFFLYQILRGMKYVHSAEVIHRDIKPRNLLVNTNCDLKICDFGLARVEVNSDKRAHARTSCDMSVYVVTRWFRAPEILVSAAYTKAIDVWAIGCVFAEMLLRGPLFPGKSTEHQLRLVFELLGTPPLVSRRKQFLLASDRCRRFIDSLPISKAKPLDTVFKRATAAQLDFLRNVLLLDPEERATVSQALQHPYLDELHLPADEPLRGPLDTSDFGFERLRPGHRTASRDLRGELYLEANRSWAKGKSGVMNKVGKLLGH